MDRFIAKIGNPNGMGKREREPRKGGKGKVGKGGSKNRRRGGWG